MVPAITALWRWKQEDCEFQTSLGKSEFEASPVKTCL